MFSHLCVSHIFCVFLVGVLVEGNLVLAETLWESVEPDQAWLMSLAPA